MNRMKKAICLLIAVALIAGQALAIPDYFRQGRLETPAYQYELASKLAYYVQVLHIDSGLNDNPMLKAYQTVFETDKVPGPIAMRADLISWFREDEQNAGFFMDTMLWLYDHHTYIFSEEEYALAYPSSGDYKGIGMTYHVYGTMLWADEIQPGSPADKAGMQAGDRVIAINDRDLRVMTPEEISEYMAQTRGQECTMSVLRGSENEELTFELVPAEVEIPNVSHQIIDGVGVLRIERFSEEDFTEGLEAAIADFEAKTVKTVIIDLRDNPGGSVVQLEEALDSFTPKADELYFTERSRGFVREHRSSGGGFAAEKLYVLINGNSASSSELMAGALHDLGLATLVGSHSYGKGRGQASYFLDDYIVVCSISEAILPVTGAYDGDGLEPDIAAEDEKVYYEYDALGTLKTGAAIGAGSDKAQIQALENRLYLLGYLGAQPDEIFDAETVSALGKLQVSLGMNRSDKASTTLLKELEEITACYEEAYTWRDCIWEAVWNEIDQCETAAAA